jgi:hypothetical protein
MEDNFSTISILLNDTDSVAQETFGLPIALTIVGVPGITVNAYSSRHIFRHFDIKKTVNFLILLDSIFATFSLFVLALLPVLQLSGALPCVIVFFFIYFPSYVGGIFSAEVAGTRLVKEQQLHVLIIFFEVLILV